MSFQSDKSSSPVIESRIVRVFISSTFRDMIAERDKLMAHTWPQLRKLCRERQVELVEVDLRWCIAEEQSTRRETLKLCLDEVLACRPYFIGLLGERYGWVPDDEAFTADLQEEQPWLHDLQGKSVTELEILHGVLNNPEMAGRAFFYLRDPQYLKTLPPGELANFAPESEESAAKQEALKTVVRSTCKEKQMPLPENYADPEALAALVLEDLSVAIKDEFPEEEIPDPLTLEARSHESFAETRRRTYIGRSDYFDTLDRHAVAGGGPLMLLGESGSGKSALLANWLAHWRKVNPQDFIIQHYIGGSADSANHWRLMSRVMAEIKKWTGDQEDPPTDRDEIKRDFPLWLVKGRLFAQQKGVRFILVIDALNQLADQDHSRLLAWLPVHPFSGPLRLLVSTLPGQPGLDDPLQAARARGWQELQIKPLSVEERRRMIANYLSRFGKQLDQDRLDRIAAAAPAANPLYLKILLDELRVTGTHERLDERLSEYLAAADVPALLKQVLARYQCDYERDRPGLVAETLSLLWAARRGLTENELLEILKPTGQAQLPPATWAPFRAALEEFLVERGAVLDFTHNFFRSAVEASYIDGQEKSAALRLQLAAFFENQPVTARSCDELPWLYEQTGSLENLRTCLLSIDRFLLIEIRDLRRYWVKSLREEQAMGKAYLESFEQWAAEPGREDEQISYAAYGLALFLYSASLYEEAEPFIRRALLIDEDRFGADNPLLAQGLQALANIYEAINRYTEAELLYRRALKIYEDNYGTEDSFVATTLSNLALLLVDTNCHAEAEPLIRRALAINEVNYGPESPDVAIDLNSLANLLQNTNRHTESEPLIRRALLIDEVNFGPDHPRVAVGLSNLATLFYATNRHTESEPLIRRAPAIDEANFGSEHPDVARNLNNLAELLRATNRHAEAEPLYRRALKINEASFGLEHPDVALNQNNLALLLEEGQCYEEAEPLMRRAIAISEASFGSEHPIVAVGLNNLAELLRKSNRHEEAEPLYRRFIHIHEVSFGVDHPDIAVGLNNLAVLLYATNRHAEAEHHLRRVVDILLKFTKATGYKHPNLEFVTVSYINLLQTMGKSQEEIRQSLSELGSRYGVNLSS